MLFLVLSPRWTEIYSNFEYFFELLRSIRSPNWLIFGVLALHSLDVFPIQIPKSSLLGRIDQADSASYKSPRTCRDFFHNPQLLIHASQRRNRHLHPLRPCRPLFVSPCHSSVALSLIYLSLLVAEAEKRGIEAAGGSATIFQYVQLAWLEWLDILCLTRFNFRVAETLPQEVLTKMHAPPKPNYPILSPNDLANYDGFILGIPTRFGNFPAQWKVRIYPISFSSGGSLVHRVGFLGWHRSAVATGQTAGQVRWPVHLHRWPWWWPGVHGYCNPLDPHSPRRLLRPPGLCPCLRPIDEPL